MSIESTQREFMSMKVDFVDMKGFDLPPASQDKATDYRFEGFSACPAEHAKQDKEQDGKNQPRPSRHFFLEDERFHRHCSKASRHALMAFATVQTTRANPCALIRTMNKIACHVNSSLMISHSRRVSDILRFMEIVVLHGVKVAPQVFPHLRGFALCRLLTLCDARR